MYCSALFGDSNWFIQFLKFGWKRFVIALFGDSNRFVQFLKFGWKRFVFALFADSNRFVQFLKFGWNRFVCFIWRFKLICPILEVWLKKVCFLYLEIQIDLSSSRSLVEKCLFALFGDSNWFAQFLKVC